MMRRTLIVLLGVLVSAVLPSQAEAGIEKEPEIMRASRVILLASGAPLRVPPPPAGAPPPPGAS
jgi:hypothetical protein